MTDTHTHIYMPDVFADGGIEAARRAFDAGVSRLVFPCVDMNSLPQLRALHEQFPSKTAIAIGLHPTELGRTAAETEGDPQWHDTLRQMKELLDRGGYSAIGEVGIDLYWDDSRRNEQAEVFARQIKWGAEKNLPVIIHCRNALDTTLGVIRDFGAGLPRLVFHSFTGNRDEVERIRAVCDPLFGINGVVTFKNAPELREALPAIGIDRIILETDSPWLSPVPHRGKTNESCRIPHIRDKVAETLGLSPEETERITDRNADIFFPNP